MLEVPLSRSVIACLLPALALAPLVAACDRKSSGTGQAEANAPAAPPPPLDRGHKGEAPPADVAAMLPPHLGKPLLVNLWATWCAPCVKELPTLAAAARAHPELAVVLVSEDTDTSRVRPFLAARRIGLPSIDDPKLTVSTAYTANLPTTILYGADGRERWRYAGSLDWTGAEARALIAEGA
jgi:thiol-disulfide isomerase/thioredoxin